MADQQSALLLLIGWFKSSCLFISLLDSVHTWDEVLSEIIGLDPPNQNTLYLLCLFYSDIEIITVHAHIMIDDY